MKDLKQIKAAGSISEIKMNRNGVYPIGKNIYINEEKLQTYKRRTYCSEVQKQILNSILRNI